MFCSGPVERTALEWRLLYGRMFKKVIILSEQKNVDLAVEQGQLDHNYMNQHFYSLERNAILFFWKDSSMQSLNANVEFLFPCA
ncbi:hypothetical protein ACH5RR_015500 [Cinchona calisaya]|uniref:Uncharacterized protein n=1 Tax=Cinchona calisaya TaxID=153742 RepID=A0ABD2ZTC9_9GENT